MQRSPADAELFRCPGDIPVRCRERLHDEALLGLVQIKRARFFAERFRRRYPAG